MRSPHLCALLCALTALPGLHGFPSGNKLLPVRYTRGIRASPRSPGPSRACGNHARLTCWTNGLGSHVPRASSLLDDSQLGHVDLRPLVLSESTLISERALVVYSDFNIRTPWPSGPCSTATPVWHIEDDFLRGSFSSSFITDNVEVSWSNIHLLLINDVAFLAGSICHGIAPMHFIADSLAILAMMLGLVCFLRRYAKYVCKAAMCCDKRPKIRAYRPNPFADMPPHAVVKLAKQMPHIDAPARDVTASSSFSILPTRVRYAHAHSDAPPMISDVASRCDDSGGANITVLLCLYSMVHTFGIHRALRAYLTAGLLVVAMYCYDGLFAYSLITMAALVVAPIGRRMRSFAMIIAALFSTVGIALLWAATYLATALAICLCYPLEWATVLVSYVMDYVWYAMCYPISTVRVFIAWIIFPRTMLESLQRDLLRERVASILSRDDMQS